ncbi:tyrosine-type recombinase/integrase [Aestuariibius insulae]|uniref:phage integrase n=1 Tax=Aestuariibius insulae TaxID=2058287 RepID=UPI00345E596B
MIFRRGKKGLFTHARRRPKRFEPVDEREIIYTALRTDQEAVARAKAAEIEAMQDAYWEARLAGHDARAAAYFDALKDIAARRGFAYRPAQDLASAELSEILRRAEAITSASSNARPDLEAALLGAAEPISIPISKLFERYEDLTRDRRIGYSSDQTRRWRNQRLKATANFIKAIGDREIDKITRQDALGFRAWWWKRVEAGEVQAATANKDFTMLGAMIAAIRGLEQTDRPNPFHGIRFEQQTGKRLPFSPKWIQDRLCAPEALSALNSQAADILRAMINTGARPSEICALRPAQIRLEAPIPHIAIEEGDAMRLKTPHSRRDIPLVGISLAALKRHPNGFPRYFDKPSSWSQLVNDHLRASGLAETPNHTAYGLRHSFSDALQNANCPDRTRKELMGHRVEGMSYGAGARLDVKRDWIDRIGFG